MFSYSNNIIAAAEEAAKAGDIDGVLEKLRQLCLDDFAELLLELPFPPPSESKIHPFYPRKPN